MKRAIVAAALALACTQLACRANDYCLNCATGDGGDDGNTDGNGDGDSMTGDGGACIPTGPEVCDGKDNDCDGKIDEDIPEAGQLCMNQTGECAGAVKQCVNGAIKCSKEPAPEVCDGKDNNCNGMIDEGDPLIDGNGVAFPKKCGTDVGECVAGANHCVNGAVQCIGAIGTVNGQPELCNGKDDDCDGVADESPIDVGGPCGVSNIGECHFGTLMCMGGGPICVGDQGPTFEICDGKDNDCDGVVDNGFDLDNDARNCGMCNHVCMLPHAIAGCSAKQCTVASCEADYFDIDKVASNGCEYGPCQIQGPVEACNGVDDNCNGQIDEGLTPPPICNQVGECAGTVATCMGAAGWKCVYPPTVSVDANGNIIPETTCDGLDNDCDGKVDEAQPNLGQTCHDSGLGVCQGTGTFVCDSANPTGPAVCDITQPGGTASPETCDGKDNDCDGTIDEGANTGNLPGQDWVTIAGTTQIMKYEASRPDATGTTGGSDQLFACSRAGVQPWTNVTHPQAQAACASIGARLCTEAEWQASCAPPIAVSYPVNGPSGAADYIFIEAEQAQANTSVGGHTWTVDTSMPAFSGTSALRALPNDGVSVAATSAVTGSPRLDFRINFLQTGNHFVWVRIMADPTGTGNAVWAGLTANPPPFNTPNGTQIAPDLAGIWTWVASPAFNITATGPQTVSIYMRRAGVRVDAISISKDGNNIPPFTDKVWAYGTNPKLPQPQVCNDNEFDTNPGLIGDQDDILPTGSLAMCFANGPGANDAFDMSGNVKEWCQARAAGQNPIRGGASDNDVAGTACGLNFTLADDTFFFPNVGFRCCR